MMQTPTPGLRTALALATLSMLVLSSCGPQTVTTDHFGDAGKPVAPQKIRQGDTLQYSVVFRNKTQRKQFVRTFESFLDRYPYDSLGRDTVEDRVVVRLLPVAPPADSAAAADSIDFARIDRGDFVEGVIEHTVDSIASIRPAFGGAVSVYSDRGFWDAHLSALVQLDPFHHPVAPSTASDTGESSLLPVLSARQVSAKRIVVELSPGVTDARGKAVSAFDLAQKWTQYVGDHPAEGLALFRHVKGLVPFIQGREAVVPGFVASGATQLQLVLDRPDPDALARLATPRLMPPSLKLGPYAVSGGTGNVLTMKPNRRLAGMPPYLERCTVVLGGDKNPFLSYSLKKYDYMTLTFREDIEYAQAKLLQDSRLIALQPDRYFLSINDPTPTVRQALAGLVDPESMLNGTVKATGWALNGIESDSLPARAVTPTQSRPAAPVKVVYLKHDPVSARIAEKLLADMANAQIACTLAGLTAREYEAALVDRAYTIAVGWTGARILNDSSEKLRLRTVWFGGLADESERIARHMEVPLFAVKRFVLARNEIEFSGDTISDMYVFTEQPQQEPADDE